MKRERSNPEEYAALFGEVRSVIESTARDPEQVESVWRSIFEAATDHPEAYTNDLIHYLKDKNFASSCHSEAFLEHLNAHYGAADLWPGAIDGLDDTEYFSAKMVLGWRTTMAEIGLLGDLLEGREKSGRADNLELLMYWHGDHVGAADQEVIFGLHVSDVLSEDIDFSKKLRKMNKSLKKQLGQCEEILGSEARFHVLSTGSKFMAVLAMDARYIGADGGNQESKLDKIRNNSRYDQDDESSVYLGATVFEVYCFNPPQHERESASVQEMKKSMSSAKRRLTKERGASKSQACRLLTPWS